MYISPFLSWSESLDSGFTPRECEGRRLPVQLM